MVSTLWFFDSGHWMVLFSWHSQTARATYIKAALQALGNILGNQNSLALMSEWARERERENDTFFNATGRGDRQYICLLKSHWKEKNVYFSPFGHNLETRGICCPPRSTVWWFSVSECLQSRRGGVGGVGGVWLTLKVAEVSSGPVWAYRGYPVLSPAEHQK